MTGHESIRIAGIDYGTVRIGIALADTEIGIAGPYENYNRRSPARRGVFQAAGQGGADRPVCRGPAGASLGSESQKSTEARAWRVAGRVTGVAVEYFDERFTTSEADELLGSVKFTKKQRQARRDQLAAQIMLSAYLEAGGKGQDSPGGIE